MRPREYQFGDQCFLVDEQQEANLINFLSNIKALSKLLPNKSGTPSDRNGCPPLKVALVEIGVGQRVPKISATFERLAAELPKGTVKLIRINPETMSQSGGKKDWLIHLKAGAKESLEKIDQLLH